MERDDWQATAMVDELARLVESVVEWGATVAFVVLALASVLVVIGSIARVILGGL